MVGLIEELRKFEDLQLHIVTSTKLIDKDKTIYDRNVTIHYLASPKIPQLITSLTFDQYKIKKKIDEISPDIINAHMTAPLYGFPALKTQYPVIVTVHGIVKEEANNWKGILGLLKKELFVPLENYTLRNSKFIVAVTPYVEKKIETKCKGLINTIPNGINAKNFEVKNNIVDNRLLLVGGIEPRKGIINLLRAINIVKKENPLVKLHIVGKVRNKEYFNSLVKYIKQNDLQEQVVFKGSLSEEELKEEYSECSIFVFPSKEESQGVVLLEAMAAGKAVVATNIGGIPYVVENGKTGILVKYGDIQELAKTINKLLSNRDLQQLLGNNGKQRAKLFLNDRISKKYYEIYKHVRG
jgi:glycosyltransferase involved in cell wall biosynthesis